MLFHFPEKKLNFALNLKIDNTPITRAEEFDFLGLRIQENLNWNAHLNKIGNKLSKVIGIFKRINKYVPMKGLLLIYNSLFLSHLNYSILSWGYSHDRIFLLQKKVIRLMCNARYNAHTDPLFHQLHVLKVQDILKLKALKFYFRYSKNDVPSYFQGMFDYSPSVHSHFTRNRGKACLPKPTRPSLKHCIRYYIPLLLQNIPPCIKDKIYTHSYFGFSNYVKVYFVNRYQNICTTNNGYVCNS